MTERREADKLALLSEEAAEWFLRLKDDGLAGAEQHEYLEWLKASPSHISEALRMGQMYNLLTKLKLTPVRAADATLNVVDLGARRNPEAEPATKRPRKGFWPWAIAAALSTATVAGLLVSALQLGWFERAIETQPSEWRRFTLADGSKVVAGPRTRLRVEYDGDQRLIYQPRGEALFAVQKDSQRPFYVHAGFAVVRAVGTEFAVTRENDRVLVTVKEGLVAVSQSASDPSWFEDNIRVAAPSAELESVPVAAGQQAQVLKAGRVSVQQVNTSNELAWTEGFLVFEHKTVAQAIDEFNRRNHLQIEVTDESIGTRRFNGRFDATDPESFAAAVAKVAPAEVVRHLPGVITLQRSTEENDYEDAMPSSRSGYTEPMDDRPPGIGN